MKHGGPLVFVGGVDVFDGLFHIGWVEPYQRILSDFGAMNGFGFDLFDGALGVFLGTSNVPNSNCGSRIKTEKEKASHRLRHLCRPCSSPFFSELVEAMDPKKAGAE